LEGCHALRISGEFAAGMYFSRNGGKICGEGG
jgi:hypothetical protein